MAPADGPPTGETVIRALEETLALEALEHILERERLEVMERQVTSLEDALMAREVTVRRCPTRGWMESPRPSLTSTARS